MSECDFRSQDSGEIQEFLGGIYAENKFKLLSIKERPSRTRIHGTDLGEIAQYNISCSSPFTFVSDAPRGSYAIITCTAGTARFHRGTALIEFSAGRTAPISATEEIRVESGDNFGYISTHIDSEALNATCARLLGGPLDGPVLFEHAPFTGELKHLWDLVTWSLSKLCDLGQPPALSINGLNDYAMTLLLEKHPHNYTRFFERREAVSERVLHEVRCFIEKNAHRDVTVRDVAKFADCGLRALNEGFRKHLGMTPRAYLHIERMAWAKSQLAPSKRDDHVRGALSPAKIARLNHYINVSLGKRITVGSMAALVCMSPQSFAPAFKRAFGTTPAQHVLNERIKWARWLLESTNSPISVIAAETGFSSQSHLTSAIRDHAGDTPNGLRRASRGLSRNE